MIQTIIPPIIRTHRTPPLRIHPTTVLQLAIIIATTSITILGFMVVGLLGASTAMHPLRPTLMTTGTTAMDRHTLSRLTLRIPITDTPPGDTMILIRLIQITGDHRDRMKRTNE